MTTDIHKADVAANEGGEAMPVDVRLETLIERLSGLLDGYRTGDQSAYAEFFADPVPAMTPDDLGEAAARYIRIFGFSNGR